MADRSVFPVLDARRCVVVLKTVGLVRKVETFSDGINEGIRKGSILLAARPIMDVDVNPVEALTWDHNIIRNITVAEGMGRLWFI